MLCIEQHMLHTLYDPSTTAVAMLAQIFTMGDLDPEVPENVLAFIAHLSRAGGLLEKGDVRNCHRAAEAGKEVLLLKAKAIVKTAEGTSACR